VPRTPSPARATIIDVARECGVATSTVSRAFLHPGRVSAATAERVFEVAERLGYQPHPIARALPSGRTLMLALLVPDVTNPYYFNLIRGAERQAAAAGYTTVLMDTEESGDLEARHLERIVPVVDGVVFASSRQSDQAVAGYLARRRLVAVNRQIPGVPSVVQDTMSGFRQAVEHLVSLGHRSLVYVAGPRSSWLDGRRFRAVQSAGRRLGVLVARTGPFPPSIEGGFAAADAVSNAVALSGATAALAYNDLMAIGLLRRLADRGLRVPGDLSVVGCDNIFGADFCQPALTTLDSPAERAGQVAVDLLLHELGTSRHPAARPGTGGPAAPAPAAAPEDLARRRVLLPAHLVIRDSTGPPRPHR
jgi:DNA-binding LacI/PurR family transcriptional regulator